MATGVENIPKRHHGVRNTTAVYHPKTKEMVEIFNRPLVEMLFMYINRDHTIWDTILPFVTFAYNSAVRDFTKFSPFLLFFVRDPSQILNAVLPVHEMDDYTLSVAKRIQERANLPVFARSKSNRCNEFATTTTIGRHNIATAT